ncbi:glycosyltransferase [Yinghuangia seranimata]|uniref:glycosyltransferase n=1 Tax=Yinghuangia seranimata TaxID=408067 RepID=UPI00248AE7E9|nr:glycosyltransferase [Yinghuangia seranimata]MDI2130193.1 glycosyltransferase [Yinghuangia seranimata]
MTSGEPPARREPSVAAVFVTFNRSALLRDTLTALAGSTRPVDEVVVVDNASTDDTAEMLAAEFPKVRHVRLASNTGAAGGFAEGLRVAEAAGHDWIWLFNDDDHPLPGALAAMLDRMSELPQRTAMFASWLVDDTGAVARLGSGWRNRRLPLVEPPADGRPYPVDVLIFAGALVNAAAVRELGLPRAEYFMMWEEMEYCIRARRAGWAVYILPEPLVATLHVGAASAPPWRLYYQSRNHLAMALEHRSVPEVWHWAVRQAKFTAVTLTRQDRKLARTRARSLGAWHAIRGKTGRTVTPN